MMRLLFLSAPYPLKGDMENGVAECLSHFSLIRKTSSQPCYKKERQTLHLQYFEPSERHFECLIWLTRKKWD